MYISQGRQFGVFGIFVYLCSPNSKNMQIEDIHIGDEVRFLDSVGGGRVSRIDAKRKMVYVEDADGFELPTPLAQIVVVAQAEHSHIADTMSVPSPRDLKKKEQGTTHIPTADERKAKGKKEAKKEDVLEVDLHISALTERWRDIQRNEMLQLQLSVFQRVMRDNIRNKGKKIVFIHGRGEGILKAAIASALNRDYPSCEYYDASFAQYGFGATMVVIG